MKTLIRAGIVVLALAIAAPALAIPASTCKFSPDIDALADIFLQANSIPGQESSQANIGLAYLRIKYGGLDMSHKDSLEAVFGKDKHYAFARSGFADSLLLSATTGQERLAILDGVSSDPQRRRDALGDPSFARAAIVDGYAEALVNAYRQEKNLTPEWEESSAEILLLATEGFDDASKDRLVARLDAARLDKAALWILASKDDVRAWIERARAAQSAPVDSQSLVGLYRARVGAVAMSPWRLRRQGLLHLKGDLAPLSATPTAHMTLSLPQKSQLYPVADWLDYITLNGGPPGLLGGLQDIYAGLFGRIDAGTLDPSDIDALAAATIDEMDRVLGRKRRQQVIVQTEMPLYLLPMLFEPVTIPAADFFDTALARRALAPFTKGMSATPPERPAQMNASFAWEQWLQAATVLRSRIAPSTNPFISSQLLQAADRNQEVVELLKPLAGKSDSANEMRLAGPRLLGNLIRACGEDKLGGLRAWTLYRFGEPRP